LAAVQSCDNLWHIISELDALTKIFASVKLSHLESVGRTVGPCRRGPQLEAGHLCFILLRRRSNHKRKWGHELLRSPVGLVRAAHG
jgi:hypothetical protein